MNRERNGDTRSPWLAASHCNDIHRHNYLKTHSEVDHLMLYKNVSPKLCSSIKRLLPVEVFEIFGKLVKTGTSLLVQEKSNNTRYCTVLQSYSHRVAGKELG